MDLNNQQLLEVQNNNIGAAEDRISELPDPLLHHILSFLGTRVCARTSVLSKRWNHIWTSIPTLNFNFWLSWRHDSKSEQINKFMDFVDTTLRLHDTATTIKNFTLSLDINLDASRVDSWIKNVTTRNVENLTLYFIPDERSPFSLFTCESLTRLALSVGRIHVPKNISFPNLKSLTLYSVEFTDACWNEKLFSNSLVLEELIFENCAWIHMRKLCIFAPALKVLQKNNYLFPKNDRLRDCELEINAPSLVSLKYRGNIAKDYDLSSFLTLDNAEVYLFSLPKLDQEIGRGAAVSKFLRALSHVRCLSVQCVQVISVAYDFVSSLPTFHNLNELTVVQGRVNDKLIFALLKAAPNLQTLLFDKCHGLRPSSIEEDEKEYVETEDLFRHLQSVGFLRFSGEARELRWAKLILKNAESLQTMTISDHSDAINKEVLMSKLSSLPRASGRCVFKFVKST